jgi:hypothetical protein
MRKPFAPLAALCLVAFGAAACNTTQLAQNGSAAGAAIGAAAAVDPTVANFVATVNATIASDSVKVAAAYCPKAQEIAGVAGVASIFTSGTTSTVISDARSFIAAFCNSPPSNTSQALVLGQQLLQDAVSIGLVTL